MNTLGEKIFAFIRSKGGQATTKEIAEHVGLNIRGASRTLSAVYGIVRTRTGDIKGPGVKWMISNT